MAARAEAMAVNHLVALGFEIVGRNVRVGRDEIDVIARRGRLLVFCEVRARRSDAHVAPFDTMDGNKVMRVRRAAAAWLAAQDGPASDVRFDAASVVFDRPEGRMDYLEGAF